ncbi:uncharacterized protein LOC122930277 isoform X2 [Bufo gargarizans]|uniref:uncharacterized protein LOC122930277 isoform X2 n=1 Tax=Bufo gargarizans TaxID=30331 RepID=UPI001CF59C69|nr:uncharacterized protein LOC122930277 isoform X2 [Bufo gargarizans]
MGSGSSKPEEEMPLTTTATTVPSREEMPLTTTTVPSTFQTVTVSDDTDDCKSHVDIALAFLGGLLVAFLIFALVFCVIRIKGKVKKKSGSSRNRNQEREMTNGNGDHCLETIDENVSYATLRFVKT